MLAGYWVMNTQVAGLSRFGGDRCLLRHGNRLSFLTGGVLSNFVARNFNASMQVSEYLQQVNRVLRAFRLQQIEHLLSRYIDDIDCVVLQQQPTWQKAGLAFFQPPRSRDS